MDIIEIKNRKKDYLDLLLLGDEDEKMVDKYLERGKMYVILDKEIIGQCVVTDEGDGVLEIKNISIYPKYQKKGYGRNLIEFIEQKYRGKYREIKVGTGDSPLTIPFYENCGFKRSHIIENFFIDNYDHLIYEEGVILKDMIYLKKRL